MDITDYLTSRQAADLLKIKLRSLYTYPGIYEDFPRSKRFGTSLMYRAADLLAWRERHETNRPDRRVPRPRQGSIW